MEENFQTVYDFYVAEELNHNEKALLHGIVKHVHDYNSPVPVLLEMRDNQNLPINIHNVEKNKYEQQIKPLIGKKGTFLVQVIEKKHEKKRFYNVIKYKIEGEDWIEISGHSPPKEKETYDFDSRVICVKNVEGLNDKSLEVHFEDGNKLFLYDNFYSDYIQNITNSLCYHYKIKIKWEMTDQGKKRILKATDIEPAV